MPQMVLQLFHALWMSAALLLSYAALFYFSADTPVAQASTSELAALAALIWVGAISIAIGGSALGFFVMACCPTDRLRRAVTWTLFLSIVSVLSLLITENWFYSLFGWGLKTGKAVWIKALFGGLASVLTYHGGKALFSASNHLRERGFNVLWALGLSALICAPVIVSGINARETLTLSEEDQARLPHILLLSSDGISADFMSLYGYSQNTTPFLDSIANELMIFEAAYANNARTTGSITSVLNGLSPATTQIIYPPDFLSDRYAGLHLPALLKYLGYYRSQWSVPHYASATDQGMANAFDKINGVEQSATKALPFIPVSNLSKWFLVSVFDDVSGVTLDALGIREMANPYLQVAETDQATQPEYLSDQKRLAGLREDFDLALEQKQPFFGQMHLMATHGPKFRIANRSFSDGLEQTGNWETPFYLDALLEFDTRLQDLFSFLETRGELGRTLVVIYSDHSQRWDSTRRVPLLIRLPHTNVTGRFRINTQLLDIAPTVIEAIGGQPPSWMEGISLLTPSETPQGRFLLSTDIATTPQIVDGQWQQVEQEGKRFHERATFRVLYCDVTARTTYPDLEMVFTALPMNPSSTDCKTIPSSDLVREALLFLEENILLEP